MCYVFCSLASESWMYWILCSHCIDFCVHMVMCIFCMVRLNVTVPDLTYSDNNVICYLLGMLPMCACLQPRPVWEELYLNWARASWHSKSKIFNWIRIALLKNLEGSVSAGLDQWARKGRGTVKPNLSMPFTLVVHLVQKDCTMCVLSHCVN